MVTKLTAHEIEQAIEFESCVVLDGNQTDGAGRQGRTRFESCVVLDGNQTKQRRLLASG